VGHDRPVPETSPASAAAHLAAPLPTADEVTDEAVRDLPPAGEPTATITPYRDGPLIVRGDFRLVDGDGNEIDPGRRTVALCRCGKSGIKPFCDGTHKRAGFHAASAPSRPRPAARIHRDT
jgi:CDGSH-type Zn-finger protein